MPLQGLSVPLAGNANQTELARVLASIRARVGDQIPGSPEQSASLALAYRTQAAGLDRFAGASGHHRGSQSEMIAGLSPASITDVRLRLGVGGKDWDASVYGINLNDQRGVAAVLSAAAVSPIPPRKVGVDLNVRSWAAVRPAACRVPAARPATRRSPAGRASSAAAPCSVSSTPAGASPRCPCPGRRRRRPGLAGSAPCTPTWPTRVRSRGCRSASTPSCTWPGQWEWPARTGASGARSPTAPGTSARRRRCAARAWSSCRHVVVSSCRRVVVSSCRRVVDRRLRRPHPDPGLPRGRRPWRVAGCVRMDQAGPGEDRARLRAPSCPAADAGAAGQRRRPGRGQRAGRPLPGGHAPARGRTHP